MPVGVIWVAISVNIASAFAQSLCERGLEPLSETDVGYIVRGEGASERCEGFYTSPIFGEPLQLVSLTLGSVSIPPDGLDTVVVRPADVTPSPDQPISIRAEAFERRTYYRLDAQTQIDGQLTWPLSDVVMNHPELHGQVGLYGFFFDQGSTVYVPVSVTTSDTQIDSSDPVITILAGRDLEEVRWRIRFSTGDGPFGDWINVADEMLTGETLEIVLADLPSGRSIVEFGARDYNSAVQRHLPLHLHSP